jgi:hypothetical protein
MTRTGFYIRDKTAQAIVRFELFQKNPSYQIVLTNSQQIDNPPAIWYAIYRNTIYEDG